MALAQPESNLNYHRPSFIKKENHRSTKSKQNAYANPQKASKNTTFGGSCLQGATSNKQSGNRGQASHHNSTLKSSGASRQNPSVTS